MRIKQHLDNPKAFAVVMTVVLLAFAVINFWFIDRADAQIIKTQQDQTAFQNDIEKQAIISHKKYEDVYISLPNALPIKAIKENYENPHSLWTLVNKNHSVPSDYVPYDLVLSNLPAKSGIGRDEHSLRADANQALAAMFSDARSQGVDLIISSGYRSVSTQSYLFWSRVNIFGYNATNQSTAVPGQSEHHTGLAVDISENDYNCSIEICFENTGSGKWLAAYSFKYGFILRYPKYKTDITGYSYEPWHFRYVGVDLATALHQSGMTLEEAWPYLETALGTLKNNNATLKYN